MKTHIIVACATLSLIAVRLPVSAQTSSPAVESATFDPTQPYVRSYNTSSYIQGSNIFGGYEALSSSFVAAFDGDLSSLELGLTASPYALLDVNPANTTNTNLIFELTPIDPQTGTLTTSEQLSLAFGGSQSGTGNVITLTFPGTTFPLVSGMGYSLALLPADADSADGWGVGETTFSGGAVDFEVDAIPTPEPSTWAMLACGSVALIPWARRRSLAV